MNAAVELPAPKTSLRATWSRLSPLAWLNLGLLCAFVAVVTMLLWPHWRSDSDLSHGYATLPLFLFLLYESRSGTPRFLLAGRRSLAAVAVFLALGLLTVAAAGLYAAALDWSHALVGFTLAFALALLLVAGLVAFASGPAPLTSLNWPALVAIGLWVLSAPIPPGSYNRLTIGLQLTLTENVIGALHFLGIAAVQHGNIIELGGTSVGVEDACSGVRSLVSCIYAGFFFSATFVRRARNRFLLVALAGPLAIGMNFLRSLLLTLVANSGVDIAGRWHDLTGFGVLGVTAVLLGGLALLLERSERATPAAPPALSPPTARAAIQPMLAAGLVIVAALAVFFFHNTRPSIRRGLPVPDLAAILPASVAGWQVDTAKDLYQFSATLHTDHLAQRTYVRKNGSGVEQITIYLAYWRAGQAPVSLVAMHTPDACWPGSGWAAIRSVPQREALAIPGRDLPAAESRFFLTNTGYPQYVWFWHLYDGRPIAYRDPYSPIALLKIAWRYGFTHDGDQLFVRVSSNLKWSEIADEAPVTAFFARVHTLGL